MADGAEGKEVSHHRREFGREYWLPIPLLKALVRWGWEDASWGNDACPLFIHPDTLWAIWCDAKRPMHRELGLYRYTILNDRAVDVALLSSTQELIEWLDRDGRRMAGIGE